MEYLKIYESFFEEQKRINKEISELVKKNLSFSLSSTM